MDIEIIQKAEGIIFKVNVDKDLRKKWSEWVKTLGSEIKFNKEIPKNCSWNPEECKTDKDFVYLTEHWTYYFLSDVFVLSDIARKNQEVFCKIINLYDKMHAKVILYKNEEELSLPETIFLVGDKSTGILYNL